MKPAGEVFGKQHRQRCKVLPCRVSEVDDFLKRHYLGKRPAIVLLCMVMFCDDKPVGAIVYSAPPKETSKRYGTEVWELARLFIVDDMPANSETWLIAQSVKHIKRHHPGVGALVSYADPSAGHAGTIYKAANWVADGRTDEGRKTPRCDYMDVRTGKVYGRRGNAPADAQIKRVPRVSKWRFVLRVQK